MQKTKDLFADKSKMWDTHSGAAKSAKSIADVIVKNIKLDPSMELVDFGAGTGLLAYFVSAYVGKIVAIDNSPAMLQELRKKSFPCKIEVLQMDLSVEYVDREVDGIISSMTIHHLEDIKALFETFYKMLKRGGFIAIADLDSEDGTFHSDNTGVYHYGFDRLWLEEIAKEVGFREIAFETVSTIEKSKGSYSIFLLTAVKG